MAQVEGAFKAIQALQKLLDGPTETLPFLTHFLHLSPENAVHEKS